MVQRLVRGIPQQSRTFLALLPSTSRFALRPSTTTMLFSRNLFATFLAVAAVGVSGSPVELENPNHYTKVKLCTEENWSGFCPVPDLILGQCYRIDSDFGMPSAKSFGPPPGIHCTVCTWVKVSLVFVVSRRFFYSSLLRLRYRKNMCDQEVNLEAGISNLVEYPGSGTLQHSYFLSGAALSFRCSRD